MRARRAQTQCLRFGGERIGGCRCVGWMWAARSRAIHGESNVGGQPAHCCVAASAQMLIHVHVVVITSQGHYQQKKRHQAARSRRPKVSARGDALVLAAGPGGGGEGAGQHLPLLPPGGSAPPRLPGMAVASFIWTSLVLLRRGDAGSLAGACRASPLPGSYATVLAAVPDCGASTG